MFHEHRQKESRVSNVSWHLQDQKIRIDFVPTSMEATNFRNFAQLRRFAWRELSNIDLKVDKRCFSMKNIIVRRWNVIIHSKILSASVVKTVQRDCAPQKYISHTYNDADKKWHKKEEIITTAYDEGCFIGEHRGAPTNPPEYCFCSFHLCNSSPPQITMFNEMYGTILMLTILIMISL